MLTNLVYKMDNDREIGDRIPDCLALEISNKNYLHSI